MAFAARSESLRQIRKRLQSDKPRVFSISDPLHGNIDGLLRTAFSGKDDKKLISEIVGGDHKIYRGEFGSLRDGNWLDDVCIDFYLALLQRRQRNPEYSGLRCHFFSAFFYAGLVHSGKYQFNAVSSWTDQLQYSLFNMDRLILPVNLENKHWALVVVYIAERKLEYLDSLGYDGNIIMSNICRYLDDHARDMKLEVLDAFKWERASNKHIPMQKDDFNCGIFALAYADYRSLGLELSFSASDVPRFRKKIAQEILIG